MRFRWFAFTAGVLVLVAFFVLAGTDQTARDGSQLGPYPTGPGDDVIVAPRSAP